MSFLTGKTTWDGGDVNAQNNQNAKDTATWNLNQNRVNQEGPLGSSTWSTGPDGRPVQTTTLNPGQQSLLNTQEATGNVLGQAGLALSTGAAPLLGSQITTAGMPAFQNVIGEGATNLMTHDWLSQVGPGGHAVAAAGTAGSNVASQPGGNYNSGPGDPNYVARPSWGGGALNGGTFTGPSEEDPYKVRDTFDVSGIKNKIPVPGMDDTSRARVEEALLSRLNPQLQQDESALRSRLLNSGIEVGTDAYNREFALHNQKSNDARMQAVIAGGAEQDRQVKLLQGLNDQEFQQALATGKFGQDADMAKAANATSRANAGAAAGATIGAANIGAQSAMDRLKMQLEQQSKEFNVNTGFKAADFNNALRKQQLEEQITLRREPISELNALRTLTSPTMPTFSSYYTDSAKPVNQGPPQTINSGNGLLDVATGANKLWGMPW
jgi:hypothetical protein